MALNDQYKILEHLSSGQLQEEVNQYLSLGVGWRTEGPLIVVQENYNPETPNLVYHQVIVLD